ncbi:MAG: hypothetical protein M3Y46_09960 [Actinomycetota bacterium]|nr:hypothetical protein [Actinomycetota bacterium]
MAEPPAEAARRGDSATVPDRPLAAAAQMRLGRILMSEESIYGLILVSGMIVVSKNIVGTSLNALLTVIVTVIVFFAAHVYAGTLARLAVSPHVALGASLRAAARHSEGMLLVSLIPIAVLVLGVTRAVDDDLAIWSALLIDTVLLGVLGWVAVSRWTRRFWPRLWGALITAGFGVVIIVLKVFVHH